MSKTIRTIKKDMLKHYNEGFKAYSLGIKSNENPHVNGTQEYSYWNEGWSNAQDEYYTNADNFDYLNE